MQIGCHFCHIALGLGEPARLPALATPSQMMLKTLLTLLFLLLSTLAQAQSAALVLGAAWPGLAMADQHERKVELNASPLRNTLLPPPITREKP